MFSLNSSNRAYYINQYNVDRAAATARGVPASKPLRTPDWLFRERALQYVVGDWLQENALDADTEAKVSNFPYLSV